MSADQNPPDPVLQALAQLPQPDVDPWRAGRIRHHALAHLAQQSSRWAGFFRFYDRVLEPALVASLTLAYLAWAVAAVNHLHGS